MIDLLEKAPEMSVADHIVTTKREVNTMTTTTLHSTIHTAAVRRVRPHGWDRLVMRVSLMMLLAARRHAERGAVGYDEHTRRREAALALQRRELGAARLTTRTF